MEIEQILNIITIAILSNGLIQFEGYRQFNRWIIQKIFGCYENKLRYFITYLTGCESCIAFWVSLIYTQNITVAAISWLTAKIISDYINGRRFI